MGDDRILLIEDDPDTTRVLRAYLQHAGFRVDDAADGLRGLERALGDPPDLIVLDWMLPGMDGLTVLQRLRPDLDVPVILLTARGEVEDRLRGFEHGADDYVAKPFDPSELVARVQAVLRRSRPSGRDEVIARGELVIDSERRQVTVRGERIELTPLEFDLLHLLAVHEGRVFRRNELLDRVWGPDFAGVDRVVDVHVSNLRQKLQRADDTPFLQTVRGVGYAFREPAP